MLLSSRWYVQLGEGARRMTDSQVHAAVARCWIDAETPVRKPQSSEWTKLGDAAPANRITEEHVPEDVDTSAMILLSGEFEVVDEREAPPPRLFRKSFALAIVMLAGGALLARGHVPKLDAELDSLAAAMRPAPLPEPVPPPAVTTATPAPPEPVTVTSAATMTIVPKMRAPAPKTRAVTKPKAKAKPKRRTSR